MVFSMLAVVDITAGRWLNRMATVTLPETSLLQTTV